MQRLKFVRQKEALFVHFRSIVWQMIDWLTDLVASSPPGHGRNFPPVLGLSLPQSLTQFFPFMLNFFPSRKNILSKVQIEK